MSRPPRLAERLLGALLPDDDRDEILGDLAEAYMGRARRGRGTAVFWYWTQVLMVPAWLGMSALRGLRLEPAELKRTIRGLVRNPGFTLVAVLSLGLGIGATTAISGALHSLLFVALPVEDPGEISLVYHTWPERWEGGQYFSGQATDPTDGATTNSNVSYPVFEALRRRAPDGIELAGFAFVRELSVVVGDAPALAARAMLVSGEFFSTLDLPMSAGRPLTLADEDPASQNVVITYSYWQQAFGGSPGVVGSDVLLNGRPFQIVGVGPRGFMGLSPGGFFGTAEVIAPLHQAPQFVRIPEQDGETAMTRTDVHWVRLISRTPGGRTPESLRQTLNGVVQAEMVQAGVVAADVATDVDLRFLEGRRGLDSLRDDVQGPLRILTVVVILVLLIACANLTTLLLARGELRTAELALRRAVGASRWDLARPQLLESLLLGSLGGLIGFFSALAGGPLVVSALMGGRISAAYETNWVLIASAAVGGLVAAALSGWLPAARMMRADPARQLGTRSQGGGAGRFRLGRTLVTFQIAVSVPLVVGAGLFLRTLGNLGSVELGFDPEGVVAFGVDAAHATSDRGEQRVLYQRILDDLEELPGVESAALVENVLVSGWQSNSNADVDGAEVMLDMNAVSAGFFRTMRVDLLSGRGIEPSDVPDGTRVVVVNETAERTVFGGNAIGRTFTMSDRPLEVVGVVEDTKYTSLREDVRPGFFDMWTQRPSGLWTVNYVLRTGRSQAEMEPVIRQLVANADARLPVTRFRSQGDEVQNRAARERVFARLLTLFGAFALLLSCIGLHGVMSFAVAQRRGEMGVRLALGAAPVSIIRMVLREVVALTAIGLAAGVLVAYQVGPVVASMLYGVEASDGSTMALAAALLGLVALGTGFMPAWLASRVDPLRSLSPS